MRACVNCVSVAKGSGVVLQGAKQEIWNYKSLLLVNILLASRDRYTDPHLSYIYEPTYGRKRARGFGRGGGGGENPETM